MNRAGIIQQSATKVPQRDDKLAKDVSKLNHLKLPKMPQIEEICGYTINSDFKIIFSKLYPPPLEVKKSKPQSFSMSFKAFFHFLN